MSGYLVASWRQQRRKRPSDIRLQILVEKYCIVKGVDTSGKKSNLQWITFFLRYKNRFCNKTRRGDGRRGKLYFHFPAKWPFFLFYENWLKKISLFKISVLLNQRFIKKKIKPIWKNSQLIKKEIIKEKSINIFKNIRLQYFFKWLKRAVVVRS